MANATRICKVCGKEYEYCRTNLPTAFRWQDVACCREHAIEYFALVEAARTGAGAKEPVAEAEPVKAESEPKRQSRRSRRKQED